MHTLAFIIKIWRISIHSCKQLEYFQNWHLSFGQNSIFLQGQGNFRQKNVWNSFQNGLRRPEKQTIVFVGIPRYVTSYNHVFVKNAPSLQRNSQNWFEYLYGLFIRLFFSPSFGFNEEKCDPYIPWNFHGIRQAYEPIARQRIVSILDNFICFLLYSHFLIVSKVDFEV